MKKALVRRDKYKLVMQGLFCGLSGIYEIGIREKPISCTEVSFQNLSDPEQLEALNLGFSPAIWLPLELTCNNTIIDYWEVWGETAAPYLLPKASQ